jgi:murein DD-endopeptidase MepM/ murein hydrolase activator NlpD
MARILRRANDVLSAIVSEKRVYIQSGDSTSYARITPLSQLLLGGAAFALSGWLAVSTSLVVLDQVSARDKVTETVVLRESYQNRLDDLARERDQRAAEARSAQSRFQVAMDQISRQQTAILKSVEERRELSIALDLMRGRLQEAMSQRDAVAENNASLVARMEAVSETLDQRQGTGEDLSETLDAVSAALAEAAAARDIATKERDELEKQLADLELKEKVAALRQDDMVDQLEQAVAMSFGPLEKMFKISHVDVDDILATVRENYSGEGGPEGALTVSTRSIANTASSSRLDSLMAKLQEMNLLRIGAEKVPYAMPVQDTFRFTSGFGYRSDPKGAGRRLHKGVDLAAPKNTAIYATADGVVVSAGAERGYGRVVRIRHALGFETIYAHQTKLLVEKGQKVSRGELIGAMGSTGRSTGVHLHYEVHLDGRAVNPMMYLEAAKDVF